MLYGDMCGGLAVLSDVPKGMVYRLAAGRAGIPRGSIEKPPSAELGPGQLDQDTLPPYPVLDAILEAYVEGGMAPSSIAAGLPPEAAAWVPRVAAMVDGSEYKRRQAAPGLRVTTRAFGYGWRMPIAAASA
jgi:NAD+ synthase (glutamine-hydrolysing)